MSCIYSEWLRRVARDLDRNAYSAVCYESARYMQELIQQKQKLQKEVEQLKLKMEDQQDADKKTEALVEKILNTSMAPGSAVCRLLGQKMDRIIAQAMDIQKCLQGEAQG